MSTPAGCATINGVVVDVTADTFRDNKTGQDVPWCLVTVAVGKTMFTVSPDCKKNEERLFKIGQQVRVTGSLELTERKVMKLKRISSVVDVPTERELLEAYDPQQTISQESLERARSGDPPTAERKRSSMFASKAA